MGGLRAVPVADDCKTDASGRDRDPAPNFCNPAFPVNVPRTTRPYPTRQISSPVPFASSL